MTTNQLTAVDLFSGCGGFTKALEDLNINVELAIDNDETVEPTYNANHSANISITDITTTPPEEHQIPREKIDLIVGGPPCPTFSVVGRSVINSFDEKDNTTDDRHSLYKDFLRYVEYYSPESFIMENVKGMLSAENKHGESVIDIIKTEMSDIGYNVETFILDAADFGVPQHRERLFFVGMKPHHTIPNISDWRSHREPRSKNEKGITYRNTDTTPTEETQQTLTEHINSEKTQSAEFPSHTPNPSTRKPWNTVADGILDLPAVSPNGDTPPKHETEYQIGAISEYQKWARNIPDGETFENVKLTNHKCRGHNKFDLNLYKLLGEGVSYKIGDIPEEHQPYRTDIFADKLKKQDPTTPSSTITAHLHKDGHMFIHPNEARSITVREAARLQSFRDTFTFPVARTHAFKQIGNAVPPLLARGIIKPVKRALKSEE